MAKLDLDEPRGNDLIRFLLKEDKPVMIARMGKVEMEALISRPNFSSHILNQSCCNAGIFPAIPEILENFCGFYEFSMTIADVMATWLGEPEKQILDRQAPDSYRIRLRSLEPYYHDNPWSSALEGKKVLVVHPFAESIESQYAKRELLFKDPHVLPKFTLSTVKAVQSNAGNEVPFANWFEAYGHMCEQIEKSDFEIAIIGAGAYGLPIAAFVKRLGKKAIQMAGATQILFGIKGKRWDDHEVISKLYNEHWIRPLLSETPTENYVVESGCYW